MVRRSAQDNKSRPVPLAFLKATAFKVYQGRQVSSVLREAFDRIGLTFPPNSDTALPDLMQIPGRTQDLRTQATKIGALQVAGSFSFG